LINLTRIVMQGMVEEHQS